jgi:hypothetical protein
LLGGLWLYVRNTGPKIEVGMTLEEVEQAVGPRAQLVGWASRDGEPNQKVWEVNGWLICVDFEAGRVSSVEVVEVVMLDQMTFLERISDWLGLAP